MKRFLLICIGALLMALSPTTAGAQTAKQLRDQGEQYWYKEDYANSYKCFKKASDMGDGLSSKAIGKMYLEGRGWRSSTSRRVLSKVRLAAMPTRATATIMAATVWRRTWRRR